MLLEWTCCHEGRTVQQAQPQSQVMHCATSSCYFLLVWEQSYSMLKVIVVVLLLLQNASAGRVCCIGVLTGVQ